MNRSNFAHTERHGLDRIGWLRAGVLGANDGIVSTASLIIGGGDIVKATCASFSGPRWRWR